MSVNPKRLSLYQKVLRLRKKGMSYNRIGKKCNRSKSTLCDWLSNKKWSEIIKLQLIDQSRIKNSNYLRKINALKHANALRRYEKYRKEARLEYDILKKDKLFLTGLSIYWGEGEKTDSGRVSLVNSDERMLKVIIKFYRKTLKIPEVKLRAALFIYGDINEKNALRFWSKNLKISENNFIKTQILPSRSKLTQHKVTNGMCNIYFSNTELSVKIRTWIDMLAKEMRD